VPVRRYNATSARTLAVYLASLDNPEQGLCHNPRAPRPIIKTSATVSSRKGSITDDKGSAGKGDRTGRQGNDDPKAEHRPANPSQNSFSADVVETRERKEKRRSSGSRSGSVEDVLDEHTTTDHRSFVQNVFGTVAFKMLEWLTPRSLDILAKTERNGENKDLEPTKPPDLTRSASINSETAPNPPRKKEESEEVPPKIAPTKQFGDKSDKTAGQIATAPQNPPPSKPVATITTDAKPNSFIDSKLASHPPIASSPISAPRKRSEPSESQLSKGILNFSAPPKASDGTPETKPLSRERSLSKPKRRISQQNMITSPKMRVTETVPIHPIQTKLGRDDIASKSRNPKVHEERTLSPKEEPEEVEDLEKTPKKSSTHSPLGLTKELALPQSLSRLSIETIELVCDILQLDGTLENHALYPPKIDKRLKRRRSNAIIPIRQTNHPTHSRYPSSLRRQWQSFIEQAFFDVLCKPESLLLSFSNEEQKLFDTQTIWYLMLRMTRVAPSLVFDSLWNVAGTLFRPPKKLENTYDWAKESPSPGAVSTKALSNSEAAQVMNICLHALVAAAPLVFDARQLANMSRIRSYGLTTLGRENSSALEPVTLCLQYDDAFTNDLAVRLARRIFAAIPTRRRYAELLELQQEIRSEEKREPDVLESILSTLKFLDLGSPPTLNFPDDERDLHEKRVPTLILDWARTVLLQDWEGAAIVPSDGPFGGALAMMASICKRPSLLL
jgi:hypothetical protein